MTQPARTTLLCLGLAGALPATTAAAPASTETVVHDTTTPVEITLDDTTVLCSSADYGALFLKVGIPQLAALTLLDHQNLGANAPCVAAGLCEPGHQPEDLLDPASPTETVLINVKAVRVDESDAAVQTCTTSLTERVHVTIRGVDFTHERYASLGSRPFADCAQPAQLTGTDDKADEGHDATEPAAPAAGCSAAGAGNGGPLAIALVGAVALWRRRRAAA